jgi:hypothetical protein
MEYICEGCHQVFERGNEAEADHERQELWGDIPVEECAVVCNECFEKFMAQMALHPEAFE